MSADLLPTAEATPPADASTASPHATSTAPAKGTTFDGLLDAWLLHTVSTDADKNKRNQESVRQDIERHAAELAGPDPSPIESTLASTAALCHYAVRAAEAHYFGRGEKTFRQVEWDLKRLDHAHARYLRTLHALAQVRKLALPSVRVVNVAQNQINAVGVTPPDRGIGMG